MATKKLSQPADGSFEVPVVPGQYDAAFKQKLAEVALEHPSYNIQIVAYEQVKITDGIVTILQWWTKTPKPTVRGLSRG